MAGERRRRAALLAAVAVLAAGAARAAAAQDGREGPSLLLIDADTRVASVAFRFPAGSSVDEAVLRAGIALQAPTGLVRLGRTFDWVPFVSAPPLMPFEPVEVARDRIRLERIYARHGFPDAGVRYAVRLDSAANTVAVTFEIDEGPPLLLGTLRVADPAGDSVMLDPELMPHWHRFVARLRSWRGARLSDAFLARLRGEALDWFGNRGHAFAEVGTAVERDTAAGAGAPAGATQAAVALTVRPGPRARVGQVLLRGTRQLGEATVLRHLPFRPGDRFRLADLAEGQRHLFGLDLVRLALVDLADGQPADTTADVVVQVNEGSARLIDGRVGYASASGVSGNASWAHRDFLGGARTLRVEATGRTGLWATGGATQVRYGGAVSLRQPYLGDRRVSGILSPFVEYRDDVFDRSTRAGADATVIWQRGALRTMSLRYGFSVRRVGTARGGGLPDGAGLVDLIRSLDAGDEQRTSALAYRATWGRVDDLFLPRSGWVVRVGAELAGPAPVSTVEYGRLEASLDGFLPLGRRSALVARFAAGRLLPFGRSVPAPGTGDGLPALVRLRDVVFTAGGTADVRGWAADLLGPKVPDFDVTRRAGDSVELRSAGRYVPLGGLARWTGSVELRGPLPVLGPPHAVFAFLDGGRVWIPDGRFVPADGLGPGGSRVHWGTGLGVQFGTPAGPLRVAAGYKLNPSPLDLRDPGLVGDALLRGEPVTSVPEEAGRRWQVHLSIGRPF